MLSEWNEQILNKCCFCARQAPCSMLANRVVSQKHSFYLQLLQHKERGDVAQLIPSVIWIALRWELQRHERGAVQMIAGGGLLSWGNSWAERWKECVRWGRVRCQRKEQEPVSCGWRKQREAEKLGCLESREQGEHPWGGQEPCKPTGFWSLFWEHIGWLKDCN